jgi:hypothetical protein
MVKWRECKEQIRKGRSTLNLPPCPSLAVSAAPRKCSFITTRTRAWLACSPPLLKLYDVFTPIGPSQGQIGTRPTRAESRDSNDANWPSHHQALESALGCTAPMLFAALELSLCQLPCWTSHINDAVFVGDPARLQLLRESDKNVGSGWTDVTRSLNNEC